MRLTAFAVLMLLGAPAHAASWAVDHTQSKLGFVAEWSGSSFSAVFRKWDAKIEFDPADLPRARADVKIDMTSTFSGEAELDENLPGAQGFDAARFPRSRFIARSFRALGRNRYEAAGDLTIRGVTRPVTMPFTLNISGDRAHMKGEVTVMRSDFGVGSGPEWSGETPVAHAVKVTVDLVAVRKD
ncbi:MAG: YceI family protein [Alphaproteobacteria bacterium]